MKFEKSLLCSNCNLPNLRDRGVDVDVKLVLFIRHGQSDKLFRINAFRYNNDMKKILLFLYTSLCINFQKQYYY